MMHHAFTMLLFSWLLLKTGYMFRPYTIKLVLKPLPSPNVLPRIIVQILQQRVLRESRRNQHNRDELSRSWFPIWTGIPSQCDTINIPYLLFIPPGRDDDYATSAQHCRRVISVYWIKIIQASYMLHWRWIISPTTAAACCLSSILMPFYFRLV